MRIGEVSRLTGVSIRAIRHYDSLGLLLPSRDDNRYRFFTGEDVERVRLIQLFLGIGFRLEEIRDHAPCWQNGVPAPLDSVQHDAARVFLQTKLVELDERMQTLNVVRLRLQERLDALSAGEELRHSDADGATRSRDRRGK
jgi:DNA-binding transcriptional MerR regulator